MTLPDVLLVLILAGAAVVAYIKYVQGRALPTALSTTVTVGQTVATQVSTEALALEYALRMKAEAEAAQVKAVVENLGKLATAQLTPIPTALHSEVNQHPAAAMANSPAAPAVPK